MNYCCFCLLWLLQYRWLLYWIGISFLFLPQGAGFWIQFVTSFRSFISNSGLDRTGGCECCEEAFIDMLKILTTVDRWENHEEILLIGLRFEVFWRWRFLLWFSCLWCIVEVDVTLKMEVSGFRRTLVMHTRLFCVVA